MGSQSAPSKNVEKKRMRSRLLFGLALVLTAAGIALVVMSPSGENEANAAVADVSAPVDGARAYKYLKQLCDLGSRPAGSEANTRQREIVSKHFAANGGKVRSQNFKGNDPKSGAEVAMVNLIGSWYPDRKDRVVIGAHYDTRPFPDEEKVEARRSLPFIGANDGASGVAVLMEIAHHLEKLPTSWGVDLVIFDGEELVYGGGQNQNGEYFLGSKAFSQAYSEGVDSRRISYRYIAGLVLDMVGDSNLTIDKERNSMELAPGLVRDVWGVANKIKATSFRNRVGTAVLDDHLPMNDAGILTIDIIDFDYPHWHTSQDLPEKCSAASLEQVAKVVTAWLAQPRKRTR